MAQPEELKSAYGQRPESLSKNKEQNFPEDDFVLPLGAIDNEDTDIVPMDAAMRQDAGLAPVEQQPQQPSQFGGFVGPYSQQTYAAREALSSIPINPQTAEEAKQSLVNLGQLGVDIGTGVLGGAAMTAGAPAFPVIAAIGAANFLSSQLFDELRNSVNTDPSKTISDEQKTFNATLNGILGGVPEIFQKTVVGQIAKDAIKSGNKKIVEFLNPVFKEMFSNTEIMDFLEREGFSVGGQKMTLTPEQAFPFDEEAQNLSRRALKQYPNLSPIVAKQVQSIKEKLLSVADMFSGGRKMENLVDVADDVERSYGKKIKTYQDSLNRMGQGIDVGQDADQLLSQIRKKMESVGGKFENDVLSGDFENLKKINAIYNDLRNEISKSRLPAGSKIIDPLTLQEVTVTPEKVKLSSNDIDRYRTRLGEIAGWGKASKDLDSSEKLARDLYRSAVEIRDNMNIRIAEEAGDSSTAQILRDARDQYANQIDGIRAIQDNLSKENPDQIRYLIDKNNPKEVESIMRVLTPEQRNALKGDFLTRLVDPIFIAHEQGRESAGIAGSTFSSALKNFQGYSQVLDKIYEPEEILRIKKFLSAGQIAEQSVSRGTPVEKAAGIQALVRMMSDSKNFFVDKIVNYLQPSDLTDFLDARKFAATRSVQTVPPAPGAVKRTIDQLKQNVMYNKGKPRSSNELRTLGNILIEPAKQRGND